MRSIFNIFFLNKVVVGPVNNVWIVRKQCVNNAWTMCEQWLCLLKAKMHALKKKEKRRIGKRWKRRRAGNKPNPNGFLMK